MYIYMYFLESSFYMCYDYAKYAETNVVLLYIIIFLPRDVH